MNQCSISIENLRFSAHVESVIDCLFQNTTVRYSFNNNAWPIGTFPVFSLSSILKCLTNDIKYTWLCFLLFRQWFDLVVSIQSSLGRNGNASLISLSLTTQSKNILTWMARNNLSDSLVRKRRLALNYRYQGIIRNYHLELRLLTHFRTGNVKIGLRRLALKTASFVSFFFAGNGYWGVSILSGSKPDYPVLLINTGHLHFDWIILHQARLIWAFIWSFPFLAPCQQLLYNLIR